MCCMCKLRVFSSCYSVFCQFNLQIPDSEHKKVKKSFTSSTLSISFLICKIKDGDNNNVLRGFNEIESKVLGTVPDVL